MSRIEKKSQIILQGGVALPQASRGNYRCYETLLSEQVEMISGRIVEEVRGKVWCVEYAYDFMGTELTRQVLSILRRGGPIEAAVLPDSDGKMISSRFLVASLTPPVFAFRKNGVPCWHNLAFTLREVNPHD
ncbi:MAG: hypothetical protein HFF83_05105 [Oscillibacter sp.]|nr:hypothetical protein [Oscillibacter sp.]